MKDTREDAGDPRVPREPHKAGVEANARFTGSDGTDEDKHNSELSREAVPVSHISSLEKGFCRLTGWRRGLLPRVHTRPCVIS